MVVRELMSGSVVSITPGESAALAARLLSRHNLGVLPVCGADGRLKGILTDRDIVLRCVAAEQDPVHTPVSQVMTWPCAFVGPEDTVETAARTMAHHQVRRLPVVEQGRLVGLVSLGDLARSRRLNMEAACALSEISDSVRKL